MEIPLIKKFEAGYRAGVQAVRPQARVLVKYAGTTGNAFKDPTKGKELGLAMYDAGADVIFHASGSTGLGVFEAAAGADELAIGVDSDQYDPCAGRILTSMVKRVDVCVSTRSGTPCSSASRAGSPRVRAGRRRRRLGVRRAQQGAHPAGRQGAVDSLRAEIVAGRIAVPAE